MTALHITNGDCVAQPLRTFASGDVLLACDVLHEGPAASGVEGGRWREMRARFLAGGDGSIYRRILADMTAFDAALAESAEREEVVLWFEHDLFDQLNLLRTLSVIPETAPAVSLICHDTYLGPLTRDELFALYPERRRVGPDDYRIARQAWAAFRSAEPTALTHTIRTLRHTPDSCSAGALNTAFLADALERFMAEYPSLSNGLSRTEDAALRTLLDGPLTGRDLFPRSQAAEPRRFLGDTVLFDMVLDLSRARVPLVSVGGAAVFDAPVALTAAGHAVVAGEQDAVQLNGIDRWRGGVHLSGSAPWRWDPARKTLVSWA